MTYAKRILSILLVLCLLGNTAITVFASDTDGSGDELPPVDAATEEPAPEEPPEQGEEPPPDPSDEEDPTAPEESTPPEDEEETPPTEEEAPPPEGSDEEAAPEEPTEEAPPEEPTEDEEEVSEPPAEDVPAEEATEKEVPTRMRTSVLFKYSVPASTASSCCNSKRKSPRHVIARSEATWQSNKKSSVFAGKHTRNEIILRDYHDPCGVSQ